MQVVASAPTVTLHFQLDAAADTLDTRQRVIFSILHSKPSFRLRVHARGPQPFPLDLSSHVTEVGLAYTEQGPASPWLDWGLFTNLQKLSCTMWTAQDDLDKVSDALDAGHLPQVEELDMAYCPGEERFLQALGNKIKILSTNCSTVLEHAYHLTAMHTANVPMIPADIWMKLCNHPSLQTVTSYWMSYDSLKYDYSQTACNLQSLHLFHTQQEGAHICPYATLFRRYYMSLLRLPITGLQELCLHGCLPGPDTEDDLQALKLVTDKHLDKLRLVPEHDPELNRLCFKLVYLTDETAPVLQALQSDCWLIVGGYFCLASDKLQTGQASLPALWEALHPSVSSVWLRKVSDEDLVTLWDGMPSSVRRIEIHGPSYMQDPKPGLPLTTSKAEAMHRSMCSVVASTPEHVVSLVIGQVSPRFWISQRAAKLREIAPKHVKFELLSGKPSPYHQ